MIFVFQRCSFDAADAADAADDIIFNSVVLVWKLNYIMVFYRQLYSGVTTTIIAVLIPKQNFEYLVIGNSFLFGGEMKIEINNSFCIDHVQVPLFHSVPQRLYVARAKCVEARALSLLI